MRVWRAIPRGVRDRAAAVVPESWWIWLRQLRETNLDRRWNAAQTLLHAYPQLSIEPVSLERAEARVYSQNGEDGVLAWLLARTGASNRTFVEFGIGDGTECNTANLARTFGWSGLLIDADPLCAEQAGDFFRRFPGVRVVNAEVTPENVDALLREHGQAEVDVLSIDIDGNDYWVWRAVTAIAPRVVVIEYNASFGPERSVTVPAKPGFDRYREHVSGFYHGASLTALAKLGAQKDYALVGCESRGANAFFVRRELLQAPFREVRPREAWFPLWERDHLPVEQQFEQIRHLPLVDV